MHAVKNFNYILKVNSLLMKDAKECVGQGVKWSKMKREIPLFDVM